RPEFSQPVARAAAREDLGLSTRAPVVLAMAGSQGELGRLPDVARVLTAMRRPLQGLVVAGHDPRLKATLTRLTEGTTIRTLGYAGPAARTRPGGSSGPSSTASCARDDPRAAGARRGRGLGRVRLGRSSAHPGLRLARPGDAPAYRAHLRRRP